MENAIFPTYPYCRDNSFHLFAEFVKGLLHFLLLIFYHLLFMCLAMPALQWQYFIITLPIVSAVACTMQTKGMKVLSHLSLLLFTYLIPKAPLLSTQPCCVPWSLNVSMYACANLCLKPHYQHAAEFA